MDGGRVAHAQCLHTAGDAARQLRDGRYGQQCPDAALEARKAYQPGKPDHQNGNADIGRERGYPRCAVRPHEIHAHERFDDAMRLHHGEDEREAREYYAGIGGGASLPSGQRRNEQLQKFGQGEHGEQRHKAERENGKALHGRVGTVADLFLHPLHVQAGKRQPGCDENDRNRQQDRPADVPWRSGCRCGRGFQVRHHHDCGPAESFIQKITISARNKTCSGLMKPVAFRPSAHSWAVRHIAISRRRGGPIAASCITPARDDEMALAKASHAATRAPYSVRQTVRDMVQ